jgi:hypothetical protein
MEDNAKQGSKGGLARRDALTPEKRKAIARRAAHSRWGAELPQATHDGPLHIGEETLLAANLANGKRLLAQGTFLRAIGRSERPKAGTGGLTTVDGLPFFLQADLLKSFITEELMLSTTPIQFRLKGGQKAIGYDALLLPMVCEVYLKLRDKLNDEIAKADKDADSAAPKSTLKRYKHIIDQCDKLTRGLARRGIIALVDDATGYQDDRAREEIEKLVVKAYVAPGLQSWTRKFPHDFFREAYRLLGWEYKAGQIKHPGYMGKFINKFVYDALPPGVKEELQKRLPKNERGNRRAKLWQLLTIDTGSPHLDRQLTSDIVLMQVADDKQEFERNWNKAFGKQRQLPLQIIKQLMSGEGA